MTEEFRIANGHHRYAALITLTKEWQTLTPLQRLGYTLRAHYYSVLEDVTHPIKAFFHFLHHIMWQMAQGCYPVVGHYRADYDCDEHYFLAWYMPETSKLKLDYYYLMDYRDGHKFVYSKDTHVNNTDYEGICF